MNQQMPELFNGGLVTARHPSLLEPGELQRADECIYRINDPSIEGAPGRAAYSSAFASKVKGVAHFTFDDQTDQIVAYVGTALYRHDFTALTAGSAFTELSTSGPVRAVATGTSIIAAFVIASCTISGTAVSSSAAFGDVLAGMVVTGTGVSAGTTVSSVTDTSNLVLSQSATSGTVTLTFTLYPFLADVVGTRVYGVDSASAPMPVNSVVTAVSGQNGSTGHYSTITVSVAPTNNGTANLAFAWGIVGSLPDVGTEVMEHLNIGNQYYLACGSSLPQRVTWRAPGVGGSQIMAWRPTGLNEITTPPISIATTAGKWNTSTAFGNGFYWFIVTEAYCPSSSIEDAEKDENLASEIIEAIYTGTYADPTNTAQNPVANKGRPLPVQITDATTQGVLITLANVTNNGLDGRLATHWVVYMAGPTLDARSVPSLAAFRRVRTAAMTTFVNGATIKVTEPDLAAQRVHPTVQAAGKDAGGTTRADFSNPAGALGEPDNVFATADSGASFPNPACIELSTWFDNNNQAIVTSGLYASAVIVGIQLDIRGLPDLTLGSKTGVYSHLDTASKHSVVSDQIVFDGYKSITQGGPTDTMGAAWVPSDLTSLKVTICKSGSNSHQRFKLDSVIMTVYFTGGTVNLDGPPYRVVTYRSQIGTTVSDPSSRAGSPYSTSAVFQGMLVTDDLAIHGTLRYSLPNYPEYFPKPYFMRLFTRKKDIITCIRTVGQVLVVGLRDNIRRVNYLPTETDTDFGISGSAQEPLAEDHGIAGPQAAGLFDMPGGGSVLFYLSTVGPRLTDGITTRAANIDLNWRTTVNLDYLANAVVRVYPREQWIEVYYSPAGTSHGLNTKKLVFHYAEDKMKNGTMPVTGPITVSGRAAASANLTGTPLSVTANENDKIIYIEDQGFAVPASATVADSNGTPQIVLNCPLVRTRRGYAAGHAHLAREEKVYVMRSTAGATVTATGTTTAASTTVTSSAAFGSVVKGMRVVGVGIKPGTVVTLVTSSSNITISQPALAAGTVSLVFDRGTFTVTVRGSNIDEDIAVLDTSYASSLSGDLTVVQNDNSKQALEYQFEKVLMPDTSHADLGTLFKLHSMTALMSDMGMEQNRA